MINAFIFASLLCVSYVLSAADSTPRYPLWDGSESVEKYAERIHLPLTKSFDLGNGIVLEFTLIPAGRFLMGTPEPVPPVLNVRDASILIWIGAALTAPLIIALLVTCVRRRRLAFSLRWLLAMTISCGVLVGGIARRQMAIRRFKELTTQHADALAAYDKSIRMRNEKPHEATIEEPFYMGEYTVTQAQWERSDIANPSHFKGAQLPVECITYDQAVAYCNYLAAKLESQLSGAKIQIPTEAQWEYACRAGTTTAFSAGETLSADEANFDGTKQSSFLRSPGIKRGKSMPVGSFKPNTFGLYDMHGNVRQWCSDGRGYKDNFRTVRGANWSYGATECRSAFHSGLFSLDATAYVGLRVMLTLPPQAP